MVPPDDETTVTVFEAEPDADPLAEPLITVVDPATEEDAPAELDADPLAEDDAATVDDPVTVADGVLDTGPGPPAPLMPWVIR